MHVLNPTHSSEKALVVPEVDPFAKGADNRRGTFKTRTSPSTGVTDGIESHRDHNANQASPGPHNKENKALDECVPAQRDSNRVTVCNLKEATVIAPGRGIVLGKPQRLAKTWGNAHRAKRTTYRTTRGSRRMCSTPREKRT